MRWLVPSVPAILFVVAGIWLLVVVFIGDMMAPWRKRKSPLTRDLRRSPGHYVWELIESQYTKCMGYVVCVTISPLLIYSVHVSESYFCKTPESRSRIAFAVAAAVVSMTGFTVPLLRAINRRRQLLLALDGELATGQELDQLMLDGCYVFHDVPIERGNIDHVIVAPSGVYSVETKTRGKPRRGENSATVVVDYEAQVLRFPDTTWRIPASQLETQRRLLSRELSERVGETVTVDSVLALPGWHVERRGKMTVPVINPRNPQPFFSGKRANKLTAKQMKCIAYQLDQICRQIRPAGS